MTYLQKSAQILNVNLDGFSESEYIHVTSMWVKQEYYQHT